MREIARRTIENGAIEEEYVVREHNGDIALECGVPGADVFKPDSFQIPAELRAWLSAAIAPVVAAKPAIQFEGDLSFAVHALRALAFRRDIRGLTGTSAILAAADLLAGGGVDEADRPDPATWVGPRGARIIPILGVIDGGKVVPMGGGIERRFSP